MLFYIYTSCVFMFNIIIGIKSEFNFAIIRLGPFYFVQPLKITLNERYINYDT